MRIKHFVGGVLVATLFAGVSAPVAATEESDDGTIVVNGVQYGPEDGLVQDEFQFVIEPGGGPVGMDFSSGIMPMATWGTSYAISTETLQLHYESKTLAAGNVYQGKRIIQVCSWYTRGGEKVSSKKCSGARNMGDNRWVAGVKVTDGVWDSLDPFAPKTIFNFETSRINP